MIFIRKFKFINLLKLLTSKKNDNHSYILIDSLDNFFCYEVKSSKKIVQDDQRIKRLISFMELMRWNLEIYGVNVELINS